ncbi:uncharacterized protein [Acropora muricata]|uniref:uncharacterized protein n=1 Tax=Acropora muricata TaxID=159855 RepID=UPI0034E53D55
MTTPDEPDTRKRMIDQAGSLRNGHKNEETAGTEQKLDSSERNNNSIDKTFRAHSIDKQKEKRVDDMMGDEKQKDVINGRDEKEGQTQEGVTKRSDEQEGQNERDMINRNDEKECEKQEDVLKRSDEKEDLE